MTTEYTGPEFAPKFYRAMADWHEAGADKNTDPRMNIEQRPNAGWQWAHCDADSVMRGVGGFFRWKPAPKRTVVIGYIRKDGDWNGKELVAPETVAPAYRAMFFQLNYEGEEEWMDHQSQRKALANGLVFLTQKDAQAMSDWVTHTTPEQARQMADLYRATGTPVSVAVVHSLCDQLEAVTEERDAYKLDARRLDWIRRNLFGHKWNGVIDSGSQTRWDIWSGFRHVTANFIGPTFRDAVDAAIAKEAK